MKAQSPRLTFSQELHYSLAACMIVRPLNQTQQCRPGRESSEGEWGLFIPRRTGRLSPDLSLVSIAILTLPTPCANAAIEICPIMVHSICPPQLVLLCHKRRMQQNGQQVSRLSRNLASLIRSVAIEYGLCRSARMR